MLPPRLLALARPWWNEAKRRSPAGSCLGGFRTPAACPGRATGDGRRPKTCTKAAPDRPIRDIAQNRPGEYDPA